MGATYVNRLNTVKQTSIGNRPSGWFIRERVDQETGKGISLEFGAYLDHDAFISIPVHFNMKHMFNKIECDDKEFTYYSIPADTQFAVSHYTSKRTNKQNVILVPPTENNPAVMISAFAHGSNTMVLNCEQIASENTKVLKKYFDKDRTYIGVISATPVDPEGKTPSISVYVLKEGIINTKHLTTTTMSFGLYDGNTEQDVEDVEEPLNTQFIKFPMYLRPNRDNRNYHKNDETAKETTSTDVDTTSTNTADRQETPRNGNNNYRRNYRKEYIDNDDDRRNDRRDRRNGNRRDYRRRNYED